jgi:hypothetical protein
MSAAYFEDHPTDPNKVIIRKPRYDDDDIQEYVRTWQGLTDEEIVLIVAECAASHQHTDIHFARAIEAKLKEKNT